ncbi:TPA: DUF1642 domain-containing protein [Streptococcus suis]
MNKQEALKRIEQMGEYERFVDEPISKSSVLNIISQIHEPQKVVVPKCVGEWIEEAKNRNFCLVDALVSDLNPTEVDEWLYGENDKNQDTFARALLFGYEIEREKLYTVEIPNPVLTDNSDSVTVLMKIDSGVILTDVVNYIGRKQEPVYQLTESEIKEDFEWAWQFREEVD